MPIGKSLRAASPSSSPVHRRLRVGRNELIPPLLVVAIANTGRNRDFLTAPAAGQDQPLETTAGGFFSLYSLLRYVEPFDAYIAAGPSVWWNDEEVLRMLASGAPRRVYGGKALFMSLGDEGADAKSQLGRLGDQLEESADGGLHWTYRQMDAETHGSTPHRTVYEGLEFVFEGWNLKQGALALYDEVGIAGIDAHFEELDRRFGYDRGMPQAVIGEIGAKLYEAGRLDDIAELISYDPLNYPTSPANIAL